MKYLLYPLIAFMAGAAIAIQAGLNSRLGVLLKNSIMAAAVVYLGSFIFTGFYLILSSGYMIDKANLRQVPIYLWFTGGVLSAMAISSMYWLIPRSGVGPAMSFYLVGQLIFSIAAGHYGWFDLPVTSVTSIKMAGIVFLIIGVIMINFRP